MTVEAVILAGGKGTRSADPGTAKLAQVIGDESLLGWHIRLLNDCDITQAVVVAGHLGDQVQELVDRTEIADDHLQLEVIHEVAQNGTVAALRLAAEQSNANEFLVILGDILMALTLQDFLERWRESSKGVAVVVHPSTHPHDSDAVCLQRDGGVLVVPKSQPRDHIPNMSSAGLFAITRDALLRYTDCRDFGSDVLPASADQEDLFAYVTSHYLKDTGTAERLEAARRDVVSGAFSCRGSLAPRPALFLDRDGVINPSDPEFYGPEHYRLNVGVALAIGEANAAGIPVLVVTNQPHIAKGLMTFEDHERVRARMDRLLGQFGAFVDDYYYCPHHPDGGFDDEVAELKVVCECRKPGAAMAYSAAKHHHIDLSRSVMVGDTDRDQGLAEATGMRFVRVGADPRDLDAPDCFSDPAEAIRRGIEMSTC